MVPNNMMNPPSEDYPNLFPTVIPPPPPSAAGFFAIPPPPDTSTLVPPTKKPQSNGALIALVTVLAIFLVVIALFSLYKRWNKEVKESQQHVEQPKANRVRSSKNGKKSNVHARDVPVYGYDRRLSKKSNGRLMEARYGKDPKTNHSYDGDLESGFVDSSSGDDSNFYLKKSVIDAEHVTKSNAYKGEENTSSKPETTHNAAICNGTVLSICNKVDTKSNADEEEEEEEEEEEDVHSETGTIHDRQSEPELAKDCITSDAPESNLESALGETSPSKSKHEKVRPGKHKKGKSKLAKKEREG